MDEKCQGRRLLAIDDDEKILKIYDELCTQRGLTVTKCPDPTQVIALLKAHPYDAALLDIRMPGLEGTDLLPLVKRVRPDLPVILVSAYCDDVNAGYYRSLGAFDIVSKPFSSEVLIDTIARAIEQEERIPLVLTSLSLREARNQTYRKLILAALRKTNWNQVKAAELLGVSRYCLMRWMKKLGIAY